ncbi:hypothetical protein COHA_002374 [Chlorella ohadii]|uniref:Uncharacterized protein n=1 Tax=Chlorella ohadii TaxID=2649997 RepID=A0AAD5E0K8_9CHLO|nr:hypothetical protein COHA_002374 [Chlorella ohadii]
MGAAAAAAPDASPAAAPAAAPGGEPGDSQSATELRRLHSELGAYVPELHQVHHLLEASLALGDNTEVAPMLRQRLRQCEVAALVLSSPLTVLAGHEERDLEALRSIKAFIDDSVTTLRDHKALLEAMAGPSGGLYRDASFGTTQRQWQKCGVLVKQNPWQYQNATGTVAASAAARQSGAAQQQQQGQQPPQAQQQHAFHPLQLGQQQHAQPLLVQQPPAMFGRSIEMLPLLPSMEGLPSLGQLLEEPLTTVSLRMLSIREEEEEPWAGPPEAAGAAAAVAAAAAQQQQQLGLGGGPGGALDGPPEVGDSLLMELAGASLPAIITTAADGSAAAPSGQAPSPQASGDLEGGDTDGQQYRRVSFRQSGTPSSTVSTGTGRSLFTRKGPVRDADGQVK